MGDATAGDDAFAAFMGEVSELAAQQDKQGMEDRKDDATPKPQDAPAASGSTPTNPAAQAEGGAGGSRGAVTARDTVVRPAQTTSHHYVARPSAKPGSGAQSSQLQGIAARDWEKRQQAARAASATTAAAPDPIPPQPSLANKSDRVDPSLKSYVREIAGERWVDPSLGEWPENDFRLFVGNLGHEVTDDMLNTAFGKYASFNKAKVVRDTKTFKAKGYGFVSFADGTDFAKALREMNNKYIGNRPVKLSRSDWKQRNTGKHARDGVRGGAVKKRRREKHHLPF